MVVAMFGAVVVNSSNELWMIVTTYDIKLLIFLFTSLLKIEQTINQF